MHGKKKKKKSTVITRQGAAGFLTFAGRLRCERLLLLLLLASQLSRVCRVPSSRSRQQRRLARGAAQSTANFLCTHRTRSAVGAVPFRPRGVEGDKKKKKKRKVKRSSGDELSSGDQEGRRGKVSHSSTGTAG